MVDIQVRVLHRPSVAHLPTIYRELGTDYAERVLPSIVNEVLKSVVAQFNASSVLLLRGSKRDRLLTFGSAPCPLLSPPTPRTHRSPRTLLGYLAHRRPRPSPTHHRLATTNAHPTAL